jgi:predicted acyl esterase
MARRTDNRGPLTALAVRVAAARAGLGPPTTRYTVSRDIDVDTRDGERLRTDLYQPSRPSGTVLMRTPYGRANLPATVLAGLYAERGHRVVLQSVRGTFGSTGTFEPGVSEAADAADTVAWMRTQPWFDGRFATVGASYLGFTQWALLSDPPPELTTSVIAMAPHDFAESGWSTGSFALADFLTWSYQVAHQENGGTLRTLARALTTSRRLRTRLRTVPLRDAGRRILKGRAGWHESWLRTPDTAHPYWQPSRLGGALQRAGVPVLLVTGWQDVFLTQTLEQYRRLVDSGAEPALIVGPWTHGEGGGDLIRESLRWLAGPRWSGARIHVTGSRDWRDMPEWPPATVDSVLYLRPRAALGERHPDGDGVLARFVFDPADPTPTVGGRLLFTPSGYREDGSLAARADVVTFSTAPLPDALEVLGTPRIELVHRTDTGFADVWVRISEVGADGRSRNVSDGYVRREAGAPPVLRLDLDPIAHRFARGSRIRLMIAGGSHPRYARNHGTGEPAWTATRMVPTTHEIGAGSRLVLPVPR